jgi:hypothetical protein
MTPIGDTIKPLTGDLRGLWRYRIGDARLVYFPQIEFRKITLISFGGRGGIYESLPKFATLARDHEAAQKAKPQRRT